MRSIFLMMLVAAGAASGETTSPMFADPTPAPGASPSAEIPGASASAALIEPVIKPELLRLVPTLLVADLSRAAAFYTKSLGFQVELSKPNYVAVGRDGVQIGLALDKSRAANARMSCYINVNGVDALHREYVERKVELARDIATQPSKMREFMVLDPDNNTLIFGEYTGN